ncbi:MAG: NUMOD4 domain-containing protein [Alphaproteobacteria bacterium]|nr:NUMOD4 domain-containing protein [Alphaproteobacteria bacterium]
MNEVWKDIHGYVGIYQVSNFGRVKALPKIVNAKNGSTRTMPEVIMNAEINYNGYPTIKLVINGKRMRHRVHLLVWDAFGNGIRNGKRVVVDHIDNNKINCHISNLQLLSGRENIIKAKKRIERLTGAYFNGNVWFSQIKIKGTCKYLGAFKSEIEAHNAYMGEKELLTLKTS